MPRPEPERETGDVRSRLIAPALSVSAILWQLGTTLLSLATASGVTRIDRFNYETEFSNGPIDALGWLSVILIALAAYRSLAWGLVAVAGVTAVQWAGAHEVVQRYQESGWGDGLESLAYLAPIAMLVVGLLTTVVAGLAGRAARRVPVSAPPQDAAMLPR